MQRILSTSIQMHCRQKNPKEDREHCCLVIQLSGPVSPRIVQSLMASPNPLPLLYSLFFFTRCIPSRDTGRLTLGEHVVLRDRANALRRSQKKIYVFLVNLPVVSGMLCGSGTKRQTEGQVMILLIKKLNIYSSPLPTPLFRLAHSASASLPHQPPDFTMNGFQLGLACFGFLLQNCLKRRRKRRKQVKARSRLRQRGAVLFWSVKLKFLCL